MLTNLNIKNYALINQLSLTLDNGLTTITGETGTGKSIILGGLGLVLGNRFDTGALLNPSQKCVIEATFDLSKFKLKSFFDTNDLDFELHTIIRRELTPSGKSRAFINDTPVTLNVLLELKSHLIDIHSQHETLQLNELDFQFKVLDDLAETQELLADYQSIKSKYEASKSALEALEKSLEIERAQHDYHSFLYQELEQVNLEVGTIEQLEQEQKRLSHIELIQQNLLEANTLLNADNNSLLEQLYTLKESLQKIKGFDTRYSDLFDRIQANYVELEDISRELGLIIENEDFTSSNIDEVNERLHKLHLLLQKHNVSSETELIAVKQSLEDKINLVSNADGKIAEKQQEISQFKEKLIDLSEKISIKRQNYIPEFENKVTAILKTLGIKDAVFNISLQPSQAFNTYGRDTVEWLFSANKGIKVAALRKVASGGELSRVMLAIKTLWAQKAQLPTIIFDEIDTGISGEIALKMADILQQLAENLQVICITHLPQIASKGVQHYKVYKAGDEVTNTQIKQLDAKERQLEIAEMLGGKSLTETALNHAAELLK